MLSTLSWIDFSEKDRRRMLDVVNLFREQDTRDELGIGSVRDALAETLFPGTTTIMTRARYFLFVPWVYLKRERIIRDSGGHRAKSPVADLCRDTEMYLIDALKAGGATPGVIGVDAGRQLQRLPSSVYWAGLGRWGIRRFPGSQTEYHRHLQRFDPYRVVLVLDDDAQPVGDTSAGNWHPAIPDPPSRWLTETTLDLTKEEAIFLAERILGRCGGTLLAHLVDRGEPLDEGSDVDFPWQHPQLGGCPAHIQQELEHARRFSWLMHGAALLYNLMLAEQVGRSDWTVDYRKRLEDWAAELRAVDGAWRRWQLPDFWAIVTRANPRVAPPTQHFVESWIEQVRSMGDPVEVTDDVHARQLVHHRELRLKGSRSRLADPRRREQWGGASGTAVMDYRWATVRTIVDDILAGLG